ncbi:MAG: MBL fold metallo-hydrolase [bacterium]
MKANRLKNKSLAVLTASLLAVFLLAASGAHAAHDLYIWEVYGNGNPGTGTLIKGPNGTVVLYDSGEGNGFAQQIKGILDSQGITYIDYVIIGHYDEDHCGGLYYLSNLMGGVSHFGTFYDRGGDMRADDSRPLFFVNNYLPLVTSGNRQIPALGPNIIDLGNGASISFLTRGRPDYVSSGADDYLDVYAGSPVRVFSIENNKSITMLVTYDGFDMFIGSDAQDSNELAAAGVISNTLGRGVDVILIDHHGSKTSSSDAFLASIDPEYALISCWDNAFGHPHSEVVDYLHYYVETGEGRQTIVRIDPGDIGDPDWAPENMFPECHTTNGHIVVSTDGTTYTVDGNGMTDPYRI